MAMLKTMLSLKKYDKNHRLLQVVEKESRSWLRHFIELLYPDLYYQTNVCSANNDIGGVARTLLRTGDGNQTGENLTIASTPGGTHRAVFIGGGGGAYSLLDGQYIGIVVGTGAAAPTPADNALGTRIVHGEGAGTLLYGGCEVYGLTEVNPNASFTIRRYFTNVLGGDINVTECGLYSPATVNPAAVWVFCIARDTFGAITVSNTEILEITYTPQITV